MREISHGRATGKGRSRIASTIEASAAISPIPAASDNAASVRMAPHRSPSPGDFSLSYTCLDYMRIATSLLLSLSYVSFAQVPAEDSRNVTVITLDTHFAPPAFKSKAQWETRAAQLRKQIQFAAGLLPMPEKAPLGVQIFGRLERKGYTVEKVLIETMPGFYLGGNSNVPPAGPQRAVSSHRFASRPLGVRAPRKLGRRFHPGALHQPCPSRIRRFFLRHDRV